MGLTDSFKGGSSGQDHVCLVAAARYSALSGLCGSEAHVPVPPARGPEQSTLAPPQHMGAPSSLGSEALQGRSIRRGG